MASLTVRRNILIHASPEIVWKVHTDIDAWSGWQSGISSARTLSPLEAKSEFEWKSGGASLATRAMHTWTFTAGQGGTLVTTDESMTGWLVSLLKVSRRFSTSSTCGCATSRQVRAWSVGWFASRNSSY
jgi:hypothetical protein